MTSVLTSRQGPALQPRPSSAGGDRGAVCTGQRAACAAEEVGYLSAPCGAGREAKYLRSRGSSGSPNLSEAAGPVGVAPERGREAGLGPTPTLTRRGWSSLGPISCTPIKTEVICGCRPAATICYWTCAFVKKSPDITKQNEN